MSRLALMVTLKSGNLANGLPDTVLLMSNLLWPSKVRSSQTTSVNKCKWALPRLEIAHQGHERVALLHDLKEALVDIDGMAAGGGVAVDARHPAIRREAELPLVRWRNRLDQLRLGAGPEVCARRGDCSLRAIRKEQAPR